MLFTGGRQGVEAGWARSARHMTRICSSVADVGPLASSSISCACSIAVSNLRHGTEVSRPGSGKSQ
jgi:hypothetical protein